VQQAITQTSFRIMPIATSPEVMANFGRMGQRYFRIHLGPTNRTHQVHSLDIGTHHIEQ